MPIIYTLYDVQAADGADPDVFVVRLEALEESESGDDMRQLAHAYLEERYGWCDELVGSEWSLTHPRSPRARRRQPDVIIRPRFQATDEEIEAIIKARVQQQVMRMTARPIEPFRPPAPTRWPMAHDIHPSPIAPWVPLAAPLPAGAQRMMALSLIVLCVAMLVAFAGGPR